MNLSSSFSRNFFRMRIFHLVVGVSSAILFVGTASADLSDLDTLVGLQAPVNWLKFNGDVSDSGSAPVTFIDVSPNFGNNLEAAALSAKSFNAAAHAVHTDTDVIQDAGSLSFLFQVPAVEDFTANRWLFDGGLDQQGADLNGITDDNFQVRWNADSANLGLNRRLEFKLGNDTNPLTTAFTAGGTTVPDLLDHNGEWFYMGIAWDGNNNSNEADVVLARVADLTNTVHVFNLDVGNASLMGDGGRFYIGNEEDENPIFMNPAGPPPWDQSAGVVGNNSWRQSLNPGPGVDPGFVDEFAIWDRRLSVGELELQYEFLKGNTVAFSGPNADTFNDRGRASNPGGLDWYSIDETGSGGLRPAITVQEDASGALDDYSLFAPASGDNADVQGVLTNSVTLGAAVGSTLTLSFDVSIEEFDTDVGTNMDGELRFGLFNSGGEFGTNGWGESDGNFDKNEDGAGSLDDSGIYARIGVDGTGTQQGERTRIIETTNFSDNMGGSTNGGLADDTVAEAVAPPPLPGEQTFGVIDTLNDKHTITLELERITPADPGDPGDVQITLTMDDNAGGVSTLVGVDSDDLLDPNHIDNDGIAGDIATETTFDYFSIKTTRDIGWSLDNFLIEAMGPTGMPGDLNGDGIVNVADYTEYIDNLGAPESNIVNGDGSGTVDIGDYNLWKTNFQAGQGAGTVSLGAVPEPASWCVLLVIGIRGMLVRRRRVG